MTADELGSLIAYLDGDSGPQATNVTPTNARITDASDIRVTDAGDIRITD